jgi:hypothetical protein
MEPASTPITAVAADDTVYINDFSGFGFVYGFDETISTNYLEALTSTNYPYPTPFLSGLYTTGSSGNSRMWMSDAYPGTSAGILQWQILSDGTVSTNDTGTTVAPATTNSPLSVCAYDIAIDTNGFIYTIQQVTTNDLGVPALICFPSYKGTPETNALWTAGAGDTNLFYEFGVAVDQSAKYVAVAVRGNGDPFTGLTGLLNLYDAPTGQFLTNLDQTGGDQYTDVAWDNVGNLYALDTFSNVWREYSPPGSNQATTVSVPVIQAYKILTPPLLGSPVLSETGLSFTLTGQSNVTYFIEQSPDLLNWASVATNFSSLTDSLISIPFADNQDFYRAVVGH